MGRTRYLIVGGSAAGLAAAQAIRQRDPGARVTVLSNEPDAPYFRPMIPFLVSRKKLVEDLFLAGRGPYTDTDIELHRNTWAEHLDPGGKKIMTSTGEEYGYDKLLIATGSRPHIPPEIEGTGQDGVFALRSLDDARRAARRAEQTRQAVMLGGGLLNLKMAFALLERGIEVTLVVYSPQVLSQLMEPGDAGLIRGALDDAGLRIITGVSATGIIGGVSGTRGVVLDNGQELPCQMVCIGKGVVANIEWLKSSGIRVDEGVVVDEFTRTSAADVHGAGDVAVTYEPVSGRPIMTGLWTNAVEMGRCAGANMAGSQTVYGGTFGILNATQVADMPFVAMGTVHTEGGDFEIHTTKRTTAYRKLVFSSDGSRLVGALFIGDITRAGLYRLLISTSRPIGGLRHHLVGHSLHYGHIMGGMAH